VKRSFILHDLKPFSINATYYGQGFVKTAKAREWAMEVFHRLSTEENELKFKELREAFDPKLHGFAVTMTAYYPTAQFYTKQGIISNKVFDLSNTEKGLLDLLYLPKHALSPAPLGCQNLQLDDKFVIDLISRKRPTKDACPRIEVILEVIPLHLE
jgi:hypothetical protein